MTDYTKFKIKCNSCKKLMKSEELRCLTCGGEFHLDCIKTVEDEMNFDTPSKRKTWKCQKCKNITNRNKEGKVTKTVENLRNAQPLDPFTQIIGKASDEIETDVGNKILKEIAEIRYSINFVNKQYEEIIEKIDSLQRDYKQANERFKKYETIQKVQEEKIVELQKHVEFLEQYQRRNNLELISVEENTGENLIETIEKIAENLKLRDTLNDIEVYHRFGRSHNNKPRPIIIKFKSRYNKDKWIEEFKRKRNLENKDIFHNNNSQRIFINENLTKRMKSLFWLTKMEARTKKYKFVWIKNYKILVRKDEQSKILYITGEEDIKKM